MDNKRYQKLRARLDKADVTKNPFAHKTAEQELVRAKLYLTGYACYLDALETAEAALQTLGV